MMHRPTLAQTCCTTPSAMCFRAAMFLVFYIMPISSVDGT